MEDDDKAGVISLLVICGASFFSTLSIILYYLVKRKQIRTFSFDLVIMLCISDFFYSLIGFSRSIWMLSDENANLGTIACYFQGIYVQTFTISSFICTTSISYSLYQSVVKKNPIYKQSAFKLFWKNNYLYPFLSGLVICCFQYYGQIKPFQNTLCYINGPNNIKVQVMMLFFYYLPYLFSLTFNSVLIFLIIRHYKSLKYEYQNVNFNEIMKLACYPVILFICWLPIIVFRILKFFGNESYLYIEIGHISDNIIGFLNSLFYVIISLDPFKCFVKNSDQRSDSNQMDKSLVEQVNGSLVDENEKSESDNSPNIYYYQTNNCQISTTD